jgi:hypothetical protein
VLDERRIPIRNGIPRFSDDSYPTFPCSESGTLPCNSIP